jgi:hypothetical protein
MYPTMPHMVKSPKVETGGKTPASQVSIGHLDGALRDGQ